ncbi:hypothetical protein MYP_3291 [Sporocytophaga myxococcoides]|uniref:Uncharacterized protein n=1 Tax=Sporocytophaga myxococcoides TaxID=153721 RepID=A0A098LI01_9BACT|nr:hypothetical protein [Sporocytophaga myxococcoides]GAL86062.1 hypothetical protein MYP_3291 [Sporocytophaga myxococcoides]
MREDVHDIVVIHPSFMRGGRTISEGSASMWGGALMVLDFSLVTFFVLRQRK